MLIAILTTVIAVLIAAVALFSSIAGRRAEFAAGLSAEVKRRHALKQEAENGCTLLQALFDNVTRCGQALRKVISDILERDLAAAIDHLNLLSRDAHVPA